jgi:hypothetical protein
MRTSGSTATILPKLLYLGDVPVQSTSGGALLLHRLLRKYPAQSVLIAEHPKSSSDPTRRLQSTRYVEISTPLQRLAQTRFYKQYCNWAFFSRVGKFAEHVVRTTQAFAPQCILSVAHGYLWAAAYHASRLLNVPFLCICHDHWETTVGESGVGPLGAALFRGMYRGAQGRLCVSPYMEEFNRNLYGVPGTTLFPGRDPDISPRLPGNWELKGGHGVRFGYAGSLHAEEYIRLLLRFARALAQSGGTLYIYSSHFRRVQAAVQQKLYTNVVVHDAVPSKDVISVLQNQVDALFLPMAFQEDSLNMRLSFPSKFADYTATGLPILVWGPANCSAVRWGEAAPSVALVVKDEDEGALRPPIDALASPSVREQLGRGAFEAGATHFSHKAVFDIFLDSLLRPQLAV